MAKTLTASVSGGVNWTHTNTVTGDNSATVTDQNSDTYSQSFTNGTGAINTIDLKYSVMVTLAGAATNTLDLYNSLTDSFGATINFARIKVISVRVLSSDDDATSLGGPVDIGNAANPLVNWISVGTTKVRVGGTAAKKAFFLLSTADAVGYAVTATTGDNFMLTNVHATSTVLARVTFLGSTV